MIINLVDLANKKAKPAEGLTISDHTLDLAKFTGSELIFTGIGTRGLVIKNSKQVQITFQDVTIDNGSTGVLLKFDGVTSQIKTSGINTKLFGKAGNSASQLIYFVGTWSNVEIAGFELDQRRDNKTGSTTTGAALQLAGVLSSTHNLGDVYIHDIIIRNAGDEGNYVNHFDKGSGYAQGENLRVEDVSVFGSGRDYLQQWGFKNVNYRRCYGENGGKEADANHCSAFSMNGYTENLLIEDCNFKNVAQLIFSGNPAPGKQIDARIYRTRYDQGTHAGARNNQATYLKGPGKYYFEECEIFAPNVLQAAITADGCNVEYSNCNITAKDTDRVFNGGTVKEVPFVRTYHTTADIEEVTLGGVTTRTAWIEGKKYIL